MSLNVTNQMIADAIYTACGGSKTLLSVHVRRGFDGFIFEIQDSRFLQAIIGVIFVKPLKRLQKINALDSLWEVAITAIDIAEHQVKIMFNSPRLKAKA